MPMPRVSRSNTRAAHHKIAVASDEADRKIAAAQFGDLPKQMNFSAAAAAAEKRSDEEIAVIVCDTGRGILPNNASPRSSRKV